MRLGLIGAVLALAASSRADELDHFMLEGYVHTSSGVTILDESSTEFTSSFDADGLGTFGWTYTNNSGGTLSDVRFIGAADIDIDGGFGDFANEFGTFLNLDLATGAPSGAIAADSWEIDEPGFVFGDIFDNAFDDTLDDANAVDETTVDPFGEDVALALGFTVGTLEAGESFTASFSLIEDGTKGLLQTDLTSDFSFAFNGFVTGPGVGIDGDGDGDPDPIPEPGTLGLGAFGLGLALLARRRRRAA